MNESHSFDQQITVAGTPSYMCPELLEKRPFSRKVDMYSFAILMWECFSRAIPYAGNFLSRPPTSSPSLLMQWCHVCTGLAPFEIKETVCAGERLEMPPESRMPCDVQDLCIRAWAQDPKHRNKGSNAEHFSLSLF